MTGGVAARRAVTPPVFCFYRQKYTVVSLLCKGRGKVGSDEA